MKFCVVTSFKMKIQTMKTYFRILLAWALLALTTLASAQQKGVLPPPIISKEPATVRIILKNVTETDSVSISTFGESLLSGVSMKRVSAKHLPLTQQQKNACTYEMQVPVGITSSVEFYCISKDSLLQTLRLILVPGATVTCTCDVKKKKLNFHDTAGFAHLDENLTLYKEQFNPMYVLTPQCRDIYDVHPDSFGNIPPTLFADSLLRRYQEVLAEMNRDKRLSTEFKSIWKCEAANRMVSSASNYYHRWRQKNDQLFSEEDYMAVYKHFAELQPLADNTVFYSSELEDLERFYDRYAQFVHRTDVFQATEAVERYYQACCWASRIRQAPLYPRQLETVKELLPEYYEAIVEMNQQEEARLDSLRTQPDKGAVCLLDRSLEGDSILPALLQKYRGRLTVVLGEDYPQLYEYSTYDWLRKQCKDKAQLVYICGGPNADEKRFRLHAHQWEGDHYLLMGYQYDELCRQYHAEDDNEFLLLFDADGKLLYRRTEGVGVGPLQDLLNK